MHKYRLTYIKGAGPSGSDTEEVTAAKMRDHEGWTYFFDGSGVIVRVRTADLVRVERVAA